LPSGTTAERPTSPSTGEWRYNTTTNLVEFWDGGAWRDLQSEDIPPIPSENFNVVTWTGNGTSQSITGVGFQPDWVWCKERSNTSQHELIDSSRGATKFISSNNANAEATNAQALYQFDSDGFTVGNDGAWNQNGQTYVAWCWKANGGTTSSNTDGTNTSTVQFNSKGKFSIVEWNGGIAEHSVGHGLGVKPELIMIKEVGNSSNWNVYYDVVDGSLDFAHLNLTNAGANSSRTMWTSSVFYWSGNTTTDCVAYCFSSLAGYSKFGSYTGTGTTGNAQVCGFEPAFLLSKRVSSTSDWYIIDNKRNTTNPRDNFINANNTDAEYTLSHGVNFNTNGFSFISTDLNGNGQEWIYMAFASDPSAAPALADSFANKLYTGNSSTQSISGLGFSPSFVWIKERGPNAENHNLFDTLRGATKFLQSNSTNAERTGGATLTSFDADGFSLGNDNEINDSASTYVAWNWKANIIPTINTDGTIQSIVSANQAAGFSIVKWTGDGNASSTVGHGLSGTPDFIMLKDLTDVGNLVLLQVWVVTGV